MISEFDTEQVIEGVIREMLELNEDINLCAIFSYIIELNAYEEHIKIHCL